jgi:hypothetical protein
MLSKPVAEKIFRNYKKAADAKDANSMFHLGMCYSVGYGVTKDSRKALEWRVKAAKVGSLDAKIYLGENYEIGEIPVSSEMAFTWYHDAAKAGYLGAMWKVVCCYFRGYGTEKNAEELGYWRHRYNTRTRDTLISEASVRLSETLLHRTVRKGNKETVKNILRQDKDNIHKKDRDGQTPLHIAAENGHIEIVQILLEEFQADIHAKNEKGLTALNIAVKRGNLEIAMAISGSSITCTTFSLSDNNIGAEGAQGLAKSLKQNATLTQLDLSRMSKSSKFTFECVYQGEANIFCIQRTALDLKEHRLWLSL